MNPAAFSSPQYGQSMNNGLNPALLAGSKPGVPFGAVGAGQPSMGGGPMLGQMGAHNMSLGAMPMSASPMSGSSMQPMNLAGGGGGPPSIPPQFLASMNLTPQQFQQLAPQQKQAVFTKLQLAYQQSQAHNQPQPGFDRPGTPGMMSARPGSAQPHRAPMHGAVPMNMSGMVRSPMSPNPMNMSSNPMPMQPNSMNGMNALPMMRPPSRAGSSMGMHPPNGMNMSMDFSQPHMNGARPSQPGFPASMHAPTPSQGSPPLGSPVSGSPFHQNSHSKVPGSPRPSSTAPIAPIPGLPLNAAALHAGMSLGTEQSISVGLNQQRNTASPRPPSSAGMHPAPSPAFPLSAGEPPQFTMPPAPPSPSPSLSSAPLPNVDSPQRGPSEVPDTKSVSSPARDPDPSVSPSLTRSMPAEPGPSTSSAAPPAAIPKLKPLPSDVQLEKAVTQIEVVPLAKSDITIPPLKDDEIKNMQGWMEKDREYTKIFKASQERIRREDIQSVKSGMWWERVGDPVLGLPDIPHRARETWKTTFPREVIQPKRKGKRLGFNLPRTVDKVLAERPELLVPIRLEFDVDLQRMRETFLWNINDPIITPEIFAQSLVDDYTLNASYHSVITKSIQEQLSDYEMHNSEPSSSQSTDGPRSGNLEEQDAEWWERWRKRQKTPSAFAKSGVKTHNGRKAKKRRKVVLDDTEDAVTDGDDEYRPMTLDDATMQVDEDEVREDLRILVKLDIIVGRMRLDDQFEWDLENMDASPEGFAEVYCQELGLGGEFKTAIAHSIREQVFAYRKSLFLIGHPTDGQPIQDEDMRSSFLPPLANGARPMDQVPAYTPILAILDDSELDRNEKDGEKDINKRRKRNQRARRGVALPDREPIRTFRTPANGFPEIDPSKLQPVNTLPVRRAAAAAAQANIANIASLESREEGDVSPTQISRPLPSVSSATTATPVAPQPTPVTKEKKTKGLIEGPKIPPELLRPRAQVPAPTPSTAVDPSTLGEPLEGDAPPTPPPVIVELPRPKPVYKKPKDLAREAKEKEWADGQHENMIDGVWHCSNCGCPEALAVGRRQGPLGNGSQCGPCGKFWHGHKRPKSIEWNPSYEHHLKLQQESVSPSKRRRKPQAPKAHSQPVVVPPPSNGKSSTRDEQSYDDRAISPVSSTSSTSEQPLSQRVKMNGHAKDDSATPSRPSSTVDAQGSAAPRSSGTPTPSDSITQPPWLASALAELRQKYPHDRFDAIPKRLPDGGEFEWRLKCLDCPGKLYKPGPDETLVNYEVHLKNRQHRKVVNERLNPQ